MTYYILHNEKLSVSQRDILWFVMTVEYIRTQFLDVNFGKLPIMVLECAVVDMLLHDFEWTSVLGVKLAGTPIRMLA